MAPSARLVWRGEPASPASDGKGAAAARGGDKRLRAPGGDQIKRNVAAWPPAASAAQLRARARQSRSRPARSEGKLQ